MRNAASGPPSSVPTTDRDKLVVWEDPSKEPRQWKRELSHRREPHLIHALANFREVHELDVRGIASKACFLRRNDDQSAAALDQIDVAREQPHELRFARVLRHVRGEERIEST